MDEFITNAINDSSYIDKILLPGLDPITIADSPARARISTLEETAHSHDNKDILDDIDGSISIETVPTSASNNLITSGGVYNSLTKKVDQGIGAATLRSVQLNEDPSLSTAATFLLNNTLSIYNGETFTAGTGIDTYNPAENRTGKYATVMNEASFACGNNAFAHGHNCIAMGDCSEACGESTVASGGNSRSNGRYTVASGFNSLAEGWGAIASGNNSRAGGYFTEAKGSRSYANGVNTMAIGENSFACGEDNATGQMGFYSVQHSKANLSFTLDDATGLAVDDVFSCFNVNSQKQWNDVGTITYVNTTSKEVKVSTWGSMSFATATVPCYFWVFKKPTKGTTILNSDITGLDDFGNNAAAFGKGNTCPGERAFVNGFKNDAVGNNSFASGYKNSASGAGSFASGNNSTAKGSYSATFGYYTSAAANYQLACGKYNVENSDAAHIVGWGTSSSPKNISTLYTTGDLHLKGNVYIGANDDGSGGTLINSGFPSAPSDDGAYVLQCVKSGSTITYQWIKQEISSGINTLILA